MSKTITIIIALLSTASCRNKMGNIEVCITNSEPGFSCASQASPSQAKGYLVPYSPNYVCMKPEQYNKIVDEIASRDSSLNQYKFNP